MVSTTSGLARVEMTPMSAKLEMPAITRRMIFPERVLGTLTDGRRGGARRRQLGLRPAPRRLSRRGAAGTAGRGGRRRRRGVLGDRGPAGGAEGSGCWRGGRWLPAVPARRAVGASCEDDDGRSGSEVGGRGMVPRSAFAPGRSGDRPLNREGASHRRRDPRRPSLSPSRHTPRQASEHWPNGPTPDTGPARSPAEPAAATARSAPSERRRGPPAPGRRSGASRTCCRRGCGRSSR
jgi:hypothetical protein